MEYIRLCIFTQNFECIFLELEQTFLRDIWNLRQILRAYPPHCVADPDSNLEKKSDPNDKKTGSGSGSDP